VFYAHPKDTPALALAEGVEAIRDALQAVIGDARTVEVTSGLEDWQRHFRRAGSWEAWTRDVAVGRIYGQDQPRYHAIVASPSVVGQATRRVLELALGLKKPVLLWTPASGDAAARFDRVVNVEPLEGADPTACARLVTA
jgi:hypothetical protein